ncbi:branched-chain amino acid ABC transporter substrate-binding protein [Agrobacterium sp. ICMP 7243]|uniref:branched-chain amino acid ABC transporter substrate-binding protein n=1 Tax=Rhizobium rhizogenes TaxID=359 RepID=UPI000646C3F1|nr:branched-chain amino acid ABC transporter substrate-binding protein [Rhizobium rhizogenes]KAA6476776.1 branched-chain amino acid ABC transporter substrate-binding protein [Agrobacterium sp. ICMP 7243]NTF51660.1 branched-chain amino acid ABC transporter substrate-binding protein [Rhizobium rhizogenes]NTG17203.1 branched-chain amino acid ABC transporter substrate-binding protein [Rhizobium rhizogenes]NTG23864.1 branched-chain amino acid ABC transporter substrate-binding protein [Rhizobium rhiz
MSLKTLTAATFVASLAFAPLAHADITIGLIAPLTGPVAAYGDQVKNGAETAVDEINKSGGVLGQKLVLKLGDDAGDPKQGVSVANGFVGDSIRFVVGPVTSGVAIPVSDALSENGILMVTPTATAPDLTNRGLTNILRTCGRDDQQATVAANYVVKNFKDKKIAILNDKGAYGKGLADAFKATLNKGGVTEVINDSLTPGEKDYSALTAKLKQAGVDVIYFGGYHPEAGLLARQLKDISVKATIIGGDGLSNSEYWAIANEAAAGTIFTNASDALKNPDSQSAVAALKARNIPAEAFTLNAYAAVQVLKAGIEKAGKADDAEAVGTAVKTGEPIDTAIGKVTYGETGDLTSQSFSLFKWEGGKIVSAE